MERRHVATRQLSVAHYADSDAVRTTRVLNAQRATQQPVIFRFLSLLKTYLSATKW